MQQQKVLYMPYIANKTILQVGISYGYSEVFNRVLVHSVAVAIVVETTVYPCFISNVLKRKACLKVKFKCYPLLRIP